MEKTKSEQFITSINTSVFFKEFTFDKNEFHTSSGDKELADNILWLDDLLFIIQIKERNTTVTDKSVDTWFKNKVLNKAKKQIKDTFKYLNQHENITITNNRNQSFNISKYNLLSVNKLIIYHSDENLNQENKNIKFYESSELGNIHILDSEDYFWICKYLITPTELDEYLKFRERIYEKHKLIIKSLPERYILSHFLNTEDESLINLNYIETLKQLKNDEYDFDMSWMLSIFQDTLINSLQKNGVDYYTIIKEIAKLKRYELLEFKKRFKLIIEDVDQDLFQLPRRFTIVRTGCGFVFISIQKEKKHYWESDLLHFTAMYKYKRQLKKCLGVIVFKQGDFFDFNWAYIEEDWRYNKELEDAVQNESEFYMESQFVKTERYKFE